MVNIGTKSSAQQSREARAAEYGKYVATEEIYIDGVLAFGVGFPVPISHVEKYPELLEEDAVKEVEEASAPGEAPPVNAKRSVWAEYARRQGAPDSEVGPVSSGGLSRNALIEAYGPQSKGDGEA